VSFSELDIFANRSKLKPADQYTNNNQACDEDEFEYEDDDDQDDYEDDYDEQDAIDQAAKIAGEVQKDQQYGFQNDENAKHNENYQFDDNNDSPRSPRSPRSPLGRQSLSTQLPTAAETAAMGKERVRLIAKLNRRNSKLPDEKKVKIDEDASLVVLRQQAAGTTYESRAKMAVLILRRITLFICKGLEAVSQKYPDYITNLEGWSANVYLSLDQYDELLYDIYDMYGDDLQTNPIVAYIIAIGTNAAMYAVTKKMTDNPVAQTMMTNLSKMFQNKSPNGAPSAVFNSNDANNHGPIPRKEGSGPAVPISISSTPGIAEQAPDPIASLINMFAGDSGADLQGILGNLDMTQLLSGLGGPITDTSESVHGNRTGNVRGDYRGVDIPQHASIAEVTVNPMKGVSKTDSDEVMNLLRRHQDHTAHSSTPPPLPVIHENTPVVPPLVPRHAHNTTANQQPTPRQLQTTTHENVRHVPDPYQPSSNTNAIGMQQQPRPRQKPREQQKQTYSKHTVTPPTRRGSRLSFNIDN
jgi:hypothetical protein